MTNKEWLDYLAHNAPDELAAWFDAEHVETEERALDGDTEPENEDSRELILTDLEKKTREWHDYDGNYMRIYSGVAYAQMKELLDRQAAITEEQTRCKWVTASADEIAAWRSKAEKLQAKVTELTAERNELKESSEYYKLQYELASEDADRLTAERDKLQEQLRIGWECECRLQAERERYREKFGKCIDYADAIHALMDDEGMA